MPKLAAAAKILGPKGIMPSPKSGTVVEDTKAAAEEIKSGKVEYKEDDQKNIHLAIAKASFGKEKIKENLLAFTRILPKNKVTALYLTTSMGPSVKLEIVK
jgi:large subunit ribosomal protein L1